MVRRFENTKYDRRVRASILAVVGLFAISRGWVYLGPSTFLSPEYVGILTAAVSVECWAITWIGAGLFLWAGVWMPRVARWAMSTVASLSGAWALSYVTAWAIYGVDDAWAPAMLFACLAAFSAVFTYLMEPPAEVHARRGPGA